LSGKLLIRYDNGKGVLKEKILTKGKCFHFPPGAVHQEEAITDVEILEASTPHFNDRVRVENFYNLNMEAGLPTTNIKDVEAR
jgi:quercetin dioxygenase-like cupin family protein